MNIQTLKGFRDFLPIEARKRQYMIEKIKSAFASFGFEPLETPALEYEELLMGKYGSEGDKLMYRFEDNGGRRVAMRYDQTVPLARVISEYGSANSPQGQPLLPMPFKRYQIQPVWRAENTQKGRYREFLQCDVDIVGVDTPLSDAETIVAAGKTIEALGFPNFKILINDRNIFNELTKNSQFNIQDDELPMIIRSIDKLKKIGEEKVIEEMVQNGLAKEKAAFILQSLQNQQPTMRLKTIFHLIKRMGISAEQFIFLPTLARGLDYYTGLIFEIEIDGYTAGSVAGGGRYNNLIGLLAGRQVPAVGFALGFDRLLDAMEEKNLFPTSLQTTKVLVSIFNMDFEDKAVEISSRLRSNNINCELYSDSNAKMEKQLKYADQKQIPFVIIQGPDEVEKNVVVLKNLKTREQKTLNLEEVIAQLKDN
ncbi:MAG TPA: histidine--tRNA ligase [Patescibacteria group bacterium]|nr:histidine--tRNA ligase [Patescibacteria group bacterium]